MRLQRWKWIKKVCIECSATFDCRSTDRRTQWCPPCNEARRQYRAKGHAISSRMTQKAKGAGEVCEQCGRPGEQYHHKVRLADGGGYEKSNLIFLCKECHWERHYDNKPAEYYLRKQGLIR